MSRPFRKLLERRSLLLGVMKQWNGERLEIHFYWTSVFVMGMNLAHVAFMPLRLESAKILLDLKVQENAK